ncbi:protein mono-ADP-ribosyltransferase PARP12-like [Penaeus japonicus]|uniref:protein mono-ADP-ribosyltransferase PARP12-like n=1 Tax=Penaeus japonicus TaxID=27405 RepID=UPI001C714C86|nr:protein mono-ADP-ribosyltransferase PARP12-like [Penaeus japonicus]
MASFEEDMDDPFEQLLARREPRDLDMESDRSSTSTRSGSEEGSRRRGNPLNRSASYQTPPGSSSVNRRDRESAYHVSSEQCVDRRRGRGRGSWRDGRRQFQQPREHPFSPRGSGRGNERRVSPYLLVECLSEYPNFRGSLLKLMEEKQLPPSNVREAAATYPQVFSLEGEEIVLQPKVNVCSTHSGPNGCEKRSTCKELHICPVYLLSWCKDKNCILGHKWHTDHNKYVLQQFYIDRLPFHNLRSLIQRLTKAKGPVGQLSICGEYNRGGCSKRDCIALHICHSFISGFARCSANGCNLNHDFQTPECSHLLTVHGVSINEAPRDIVGALLAAYPALSQGTKSGDVGKSDSNPSGNITSSSQANFSRNFNKNVNSRNGDNNIIHTKKHAVKDKVQRAAKPKTTDQVPKATASRNEPQTIWAHNLYGDTQVKELCYYSVESVCRYESSGCRRLHSAYHYHWQVSEEGSKWLNLRNSQVKKLEVSFCNPDESSVDLPRLDPAELDTSTKYLLLVMGRDTWKANFPAMIVTNSTQSKVLYLRRLCTERIAGQIIDGNVYNWYFLDKNKKWVMYGKVDTAGEKNLVSSVTSDDIEKHYLQSQGSPLTFRNAKFTYTLNFSSMTQTNEQTKVSREVCRRPQPHIKVDSTPTTAKSNPGSDTSDLPSSWEPMQPQERVRLVEISPTSSEYQTVLSLLKRQIQQTAIQKIQRIQNPYLWRAFQNKIREMTSIHGDLSKVNVRQIFHGTGHNVVASICAENFDWRLHGTSAGQMHGRGTYFSPNVLTSVGYCKPDTSGVKYLFVAQVAVGSITRGNSSTVRPPLNPATNIPFDSTGDGSNVIVKYDKQEYYPEYILSFR